jgi:hypothetical protein
MRNWSRNVRSCLLVGCIVMCFLMATGCAATQVKQVWKDEAFQGGCLDNVLVIGVLKNKTARMTFESEFVKYFRYRGINAVESFRVLPTDALEGDEARDAIVHKIKELGINAVLMTKVVGNRTAEETIPGMTITTGYGLPYSSYGAWGSYTSFAYSFPGPSAPTTQGYSHVQKFLVIETQLFDVKTEKLIWAARSETRISGTSQEEIKPYISIIAERLFRANLFQ